MARAATATKEPEAKALVVATELTADELTALLQESGWAEKPFGESLPRLNLNGNMLTTEDGEMFVYNPSKPKIPALTVRIVKPPEEYWAYWIDDEVAVTIGQKELAGTFSKRFLHPDPTRRSWPSDEAYDAIKAAGFKASWKADVLVQIIPDDGTLKGDEPIYVLTLSTTSLIDFKGTSRAPEAGSVSELNFIQKLSRFAMEQAKEAGAEPKRAVLDALTSLTLGGVAAEIRIVRAENKELGRTWSVIVFDPVHVEPIEVQPELTAGEVLDGTEEDPGF